MADEKQAAFQQALERAKQIAAKISSGDSGPGSKRAIDDDFPPVDIKRMASGADSGFAPRPGLGSSGGPGGPSKDETYLQGYVSSGEKTLDIMVPGNKVGFIIGKGGETIRNLQDRANVRMTVFQETNHSTDEEKKLRIQGPPDRVDFAKRLIDDLLTEKEMELAKLRQSSGFGGPKRNEYGRPTGGNQQEIHVPGNIIGLVIGKGGENIKRIQMETGAKIQFEADETPEGNKICTISGTYVAIERATEQIHEVIEQAKQNLAQRRQRKNLDGEEFRMRVPANKVGSIIGRGGDNIRNIKQQCGCDIELDRNATPVDSEEKIFVIRGQPERIEMARQMISEKIGLQGDGDGNGYGSSQSQDIFNPYSGNPYAPSSNSYGYGSQNWQAQSNGQEGSNPHDPASAWAAYYAQMYASQGSQNPAANGSMPPAADGSAPEGDYTAQWIAYYRAYGMEEQAKQLEEYAKQKTQSGNTGNGQDHNSYSNQGNFNQNFPKQ